MRTYSGPFLREEGFVQAEITIEDRADNVSPKLVDFEESGDSGREAIIIPTLFNSHVHTGDSIIDAPPSGNIAELVGPGGYKHQILESVDGDDLVSAMRCYLKDLLRLGIRDVIDFREGGLKGIEYIRKATEGIGDKFNLNIFARPTGLNYDEDEMEKILSMTDGIGISAFRDWDVDQLKNIAEDANKNNIPFALHCSEDVREPIDDVLELGVHHLVHMIEATQEDLVACASENIPIVVCPRSNQFFGKEPNIPEMMNAGITVCLGTDNAMLAYPNMLREMETAYRISVSRGGIEPLDILMMATWNPRKALNPTSLIGEQSNNHYLILEKGKREPAYEVVTKISAKDIIEVVEW